MRRVTFIEGLRTREVMAFDRVEYYELPELRNTPVAFSEDTALADVSQEHRVAPVFTFFGLGYGDRHIAWSEEVERLLGIPIRILKSEHDEAVAAARRDRKALEKAARRIYWLQIPKWSKLKWLLTDPLMYEATRRRLLG